MGTFEAGPMFEHGSGSGGPQEIGINPEVIVYLLHAELKDGSNEHYVGSCRRDQYKRRLRMHATGNGAEFTKRMVAFGAKLYVALTWDRYCRQFERELLGIPDISMVCPICSPRLRGPQPFSLNNTYAPVTRFNGSQLLNFPHGR